MNRKRPLMGRRTFGVSAVGTLVLAASALVFAQQGPPPGQTPPPPPTPGPVRLDVADGSTASYRVQEQLAGISFPNDAVL